VAMCGIHRKNWPSEKIGIAKDGHREKGVIEKFECDDAAFCTMISSPSRTHRSVPCAPQEGDMPANLQVLLDRATITDVVNRYATGLDRRDWPLLRSIFTDEIDMEYSSVGIKSGRYAADRWVRNSEVLFAGFGATQHTLSNHVVDVDGDTGRCTMYMRAEHFIEDLPENEKRWTIGGYYTVSLRRDGDSWRIHAMGLHMTWQTGNRQLSAIAIERGRARLGIAKRN
jgi:SnoaL-like protein